MAGGGSHARWQHILVKWPDGMGLLAHDLR